jgi:hypothetical protein
VSEATTKSAYQTAYGLAGNKGLRGTSKTHETPSDLLVSNRRRYSAWLGVASHARGRRFKTCRAHRKAPGQRLGALLCLPLRGRKVKRN